MENVVNIRSFGARLRVKDGLFEVTVPDLTGAGNDRVEQSAPQQVQTILLHPKTSTSSDALLLAQQHQVDVFILDQHDFPQIYLAGLSPPVSVRIWNNQLALHGTLKGLDIARNWLCQKLLRKIEWLNKLKSYRSGPSLELIGKAADALKDIFTRISSFKLTKADEHAASLRGMEGSANRIYLDALNQLLPEHLRFDGRSRQPAEDIFNALLNYGYGILYRWTEKELWEAGLNPYIGFMHNTDRNQKSLVFDFIEPFRPWIDRTAFNLCARKEVGRQHVRELSGGGVWLNEEGKKILAAAVYARFNEKKVALHGRKWTLRQSIGVEARHLAAGLRGAEMPDAEQMARVA